MTSEGVKTDRVICICECHRIWRITGVSFCSECGCPHGVANGNQSAKRVDEREGTDADCGQN